MKQRFGVDPVAHVLCNAFTREETEDALIELNYLGIENVLVIRGDGEAREPAEGRTANATGLELVEQIAAMNSGRYLEELVEATPTDFCIGGAEYAVIQVFYDNEAYLRFVKAARDRGVTIPISPASRS